MNNQTQKIENNVVQSDYANLKNLQENLNAALKLHKSNKFKMASNSSV